MLGILRILFIHEEMLKGRCNKNLENEELNISSSNYFKREKVNSENVFIMYLDN
jgi:hypothetical protein